jgi:cytochrome b involved in lipid metabolism
MPAPSLLLGVHGVFETLRAGKVYDVTPFMDDHPGGGEIMLSAAGKDGTQDFEDVGHSPHARELLKKYYLVRVLGFRV